MLAVAGRQSRGQAQQEVEEDHPHIDILRQVTLRQIQLLLYDAHILPRDDTAQLLGYGLLVTAQLSELIAQSAHLQRLGIDRSAEDTL